MLETGRLEKIVLDLKASLSACAICPKQCGANRLQDETGYCRSGRKVKVASYGPHFGEEPPLSGLHGSGTIFLANCNMRCVYCQNYDISQKFTEAESAEYSPAALARIMLLLQEQYNCHNINFVSPTHYLPQILEAVLIASKSGLNIPLVYNTNGYDRVETVSAIKGVFDIYLPDFKYFNDQYAAKYSACRDYTENAKAAIYEMYSQVGDLQKNKDGIALRGLIIRHLVLPAGLADSAKVLKWISIQLSDDTAVSLLEQYHPAYLATRIPLLSSRISLTEIKKARRHWKNLGFKDQVYQ